MTTTKNNTENETMTIISSRTDIIDWIDSTRPDLSAVADRYVEAVCDQIQASDHPAWGDDWSAWLAEWADSVIEATVDGLDAIATTTATASNARPSDCCDTAGALDLDVDVTLPDGTELSGEVTLIPAQSHGGYVSWGEPSHWVASDLLASIPADDFEYTLHVIACEAGLVADAYRG